MIWIESIRDANYVVYCIFIMVKLVCNLASETTSIPASLTCGDWTHRDHNKAAHLAIPVHFDLSDILLHSTVTIVLPLTHPVHRYAANSCRRISLNDASSS